MFDCVEDGVKLKLQLIVTQLFYLAKQEDREEAAEIKKQKSSIIIHSLKELTEADPATETKTAKNEIKTPHEGAAGNGRAELNHC